MYNLDSSEKAVVMANLNALIQKAIQLGYDSCERMIAEGERMNEENFYTPKREIRDKLHEYVLNCISDPRQYIYTSIPLKKEEK